jgi:hypothetical protein
MSDNDAERRIRASMSFGRLPASVEFRIRCLQQQTEIKRFFARLPPLPKLRNESFVLPNLKALALPEEYRRAQEYDLGLPADAPPPQPPAPPEEPLSQKLEHKRGRHPKLTEAVIINGQTFFETLLDDDGPDWENNPKAWAKRQFAAALHVKKQRHLDCDWQTVFVWVIEPVLVEWKRPVLIHLSQRLKNKPRYLKKKRTF